MKPWEGPPLTALRSIVRPQKAHETMSHVCPQAGPLEALGDPRPPPTPHPLLAAVSLAEMCAPELHGYKTAGESGPLGTDLEKREAGETRPSQEVRDEEEAAEPREAEVQEQAVREQLHSILRQNEIQEDVQEEGKKSRAHDTFRGRHKQVAERDQDEEETARIEEEEDEEKRIRLLGGAHGLWQGPKAEQRGEPLHPHHIHQPPVVTQREEKEAAREKVSGGREGCVGKPPDREGSATPGPRTHVHLPRRFPQRAEERAQPCPNCQLCLAEVMENL